MVSNVSGEDAGLIGIYQLPGANAMKVASTVEKKLEELKQYFPEGVDYRIILNTTDFVSASIDEVLVTFLETTLIVMLVILLFLQNWRAVIIPMITIPVSLIATFAVMKVMGFTLNTLTLFGLVLAIAIVVDDAIVVVEDVSRILDQRRRDTDTGCRTGHEGTPRPGNRRSPCTTVSLHTHGFHFRHHGPAIQTVRTHHCCFYGILGLQCLDIHTSDVRPLPQTIKWTAKILHLPVVQCRI